MQLLGDPHDFGNPQTIINHYEPSLTITNHYKPYLNHYYQDINLYEPFTPDHPTMVDQPTTGFTEFHRGPCSSPSPPFAPAWAGHLSETRGETHRWGLPLCACLATEGITLLRIIVPRRI